MTDIYLGIGTNQGDKKHNLDAAIQKLSEQLRHIATASYIETPSWGFKSQDFLNTVAHFQTELSPEELLKLCKQIEREMGREEEPLYDENQQRIYHDRIIDIDILLYGDLEMQSEQLSIPHPLMKQRDFVMRPLREIFQQKTLNLQDCKTDKNDTRRIV